MVNDQLLNHCNINPTVLLHDELLSWSLIAPTPQFYHHNSTNQHIAYWKGTAMMRCQALMLIQTHWINAWPSPNQLQMAFFQMKKAYLLGSFGNAKWNFENFDYRTHYSYINKKVLLANAELSPKLIDRYSIKEAMSWILDEHTIG